MPECYQIQQEMPKQEQKAHQEWEIVEIESTKYQELNKPKSAVIDMKMVSDKQSIEELKDLIRKQVYQKNYALLNEEKLRVELENFEIDSSISLNASSHNEDRQHNKKDLLKEVTESLINRKRGCRLSLIEKLHLFKEMTIAGKSIADVSRNYFVSKASLYSILKKYKRNSSKLSFNKLGTTRSIASSDIIWQKIYDYTKSWSYPITSKDVWIHLHQTLGLNISREVVIKIMKEYWQLSYKKGKSRPMGLQIAKQRLLKLYFTIKLIQNLNNYSMLINIDETYFSRYMKLTHSWLQKGADRELMNIWYTNSASMITSITSSGEVFAISTTGAVNS